MNKKWFPWYLLFYLSPQGGSLISHGEAGIMHSWWCGMRTDRRAWMSFLAVTWSATGSGACKIPQISSGWIKTQSQFLQVSYRLCYRTLWFIFMEVLAGGSFSDGNKQGSTVWFPCTKMTFPWVCPPLHGPATTLCWLRSCHKDMFSKDLCVQTLLSMGLTRCWTPIFNLQCDSFGSVKDQIQF